MTAPMPPSATQIKEFMPSKYQRAIFDMIGDVLGPQYIVVEAYAGSGKTTTLVKAAIQYVDPQYTILFCAFNKSIAREIGERTAGRSNVTASTLHSLGKRALDQHMGTRTQVDTRKQYKLVDRYINEHHPGPDIVSGRKVIGQRAETKPGATMAHDNEPTGRVLPEEVRICLTAEGKLLQDAMLKLYDFTRLTLTDYNDPAALEAMAIHYDIDLDDRALAAVPQLIAWDEKMVRDQHQIDFTDMIYWPVKWGVTMQKFDWVFVDECLPYKTPVHLSDGSAMEIGDIVENERPVTVLAYDTKTGEQKACKVTGWHKILNRKPLVKIKARWSEKVKASRPTNFVVCTIDHKIWADGQWIEAGKLQPGMTVQVETAAKKSQAYKITTKGRETLSNEMQSKNDAGVMGSNNTHGRINKRGGNGRKMPLPQRLLWQALGDGWETEYAVPTKQPRGSSYPTCYKIDIANPDRMIAVEVDGESHRATERQQQDRKKDEFLTDLGWTVIRIKNQDAVQNTKECAKQILDDDCPIDAIVVSVEPVEITDYYVYDITVEDCHNFYANGILVHNCQDLNRCQLELSLMCRKPETGRMVYTGDARQAIYGFSGADNRSMQNIIDRTQATTLPLSICYRCDLAMIKLAQEVTTQIEARPNAGPGEVIHIGADKFFLYVQTKDMVLCRLTAPLIGYCIDAIKRGIKARVEGRDLGKQLTTIVQKVAKRENFDYADFLQHLSVYRAQQVKMLRDKNADDTAVESMIDRCDAVGVVYESTDATNPDELCSEIDALFDEENPFIKFATIHRSKGLEADNVFIIAPDKLPLNLGGWQQEQEWNLRYVAVTRAKHKLYIVGGSFVPGPHAQNSPLAPQSPETGTPTADVPNLVTKGSTDSPSAQITEHVALNLLTMSRDEIIAAEAANDAQQDQPMLSKKDRERAELKRLFERKPETKRQREQKAIDSARAQFPDLPEDEAINAVSEMRVQDAQKGTPARRGHDSTLNPASNSGGIKTRAMLRQQSLFDEIQKATGGDDPNLEPLDPEYVKGLQVAQGVKELMEEQQRQNDAALLDQLNNLPDITPPAKSNPLDEIEKKIAELQDLGYRQDALEALEILRDIFG